MKVVTMMVLYSLALSHLISQDRDSIQIRQRHTHVQHPMGIQSDSVFTVLSRWAWGSCLAVDVQGNFAYVGNGETFQIFDATDSTRPIRMGEVITDGEIEDISVKGSHAFVGCVNGFKIIDITDPARPVIVGYLPFNWVQRVLILDSVAIVGTDGYLMSVDIKDPTNPLTLDVIGVGAYTFDIKGHFLYTCGYEAEYCDIIDISNPHSLSYVGDFGLNPAEWVYALRVVGDFLYIGTQYPWSTQIYDLGAPEAPQKVNTIEGYGAYYGDITYDSRYLYITAGGWVCIFDYSTPSNPQLVGHVEAWAWSMVPSHGLLYIAAHDHFTIADVHTINTLKIVFNYPTAFGTHEVVVVDSLAYVSTFANGVYVIDISNSRSPKPVTNIDVGSPAKPVIDGNYLYVVNIDDSRLWGLQIIDISDLQHPQLLSSHTGILKPGIAPSMVQLGELLFISQPGSPQDDSTLEIIDITNRSSPQTRSVYRCSYQPWDVVVKDSIIYLATLNGGLRIINYSNPSMPVETSNIFTRAYRMLRNGNYLYVASDSIYILDISQPAAPIIIGSENSDNIEFADMAISGKFLYCTYQGNLYTYDISIPSRVKRCGIFNVNPFANNLDGVSTKQNVIFFADMYRGLWLLENKFDTTQLSPFQVSSGWNLLSVPLGTIDAKRSLSDAMSAPGATSGPYTYHFSGYSLIDTIVDGQGFWMKFDSPHGIYFYGSPIPGATIDIQKGWNIIGSIGSPLPVSQMRTEPGGILTSNCFGYDEQYILSDSIFPGRGYWVKSSQGGKLMLSFSQRTYPVSGSIALREGDDFLASLDRFELKSLDGQAGQVLYIGEKIDESMLKHYELPPRPPPGCFDARFASDRMVENIENGDTSGRKILLSSTKYPILFNWEVQSKDKEYILHISGNDTPLKMASGCVQIPGGSDIRLGILGDLFVPAEARLDQNYPNPFNGSTTIQFSVPKSSGTPVVKIPVSIRVYDVLGQEVAVLLDEEMGPGNYQAMWNAENYPTGTYYYRFKCGEIVSVRSMILMK